MEKQICKCGHSKKPFHGYSNIIGCGYVFNAGTDKVKFCDCNEFRELKKNNMTEETFICSKCGKSCRMLILPDELPDDVCLSCDDNRYHD